MAQEYNRQYIGARYVPVFFNNPDGSWDWASGFQYEPLTMVKYGTNTYTSKQLVPSTIGSPNTAPEYWALTGDYNGAVVSLQETLNNIKYYVTPEEYGAIGDGVTNDTAAFASAFASGFPVIAGNKSYVINTLTIRSDFICFGNLIYNGTSYAINCGANYQRIFINRITASAGSGILVNPSGGCHGFHIEVRFINALNNGICIQPLSGGFVQYCVFSFDRIECNKGIVLDSTANNTWVNENRFNGGQLVCETCISSVQVGQTKYNGNKFQDVGFEQSTYYAVLYDCYESSIHNARMIETENNAAEYRIYLNNCKRIDISASSNFEFSRIKLTSSDAFVSGVLVNSAQTPIAGKIKMTDSYNVLLQAINDVPCWFNISDISDITIPDNYNTDFMYFNTTGNGNATITSQFVRKKVTSPQSASGKSWSIISVSGTGSVNLTCSGVTKNLTNGVYLANFVDDNYLLTKLT